MGVAVGEAVNVEVGSVVCVGGGGVEVAETVSLVGEEALFVVPQELKSRNPIRRMKLAARNFFMPLRRFFWFGYYSLMAYLIAFESLMLRTVPKVGLAQQGTFKETFGTFCVS